MILPKMILSILVASALLPTLAEDVNLLINGDLQTGGPGYTPGWVFSKWQLKDGTPEAAAAKSGIVKEPGNDANQCLWVATTAPVKAYIWFQQEVACDPAETYTLTFRAKGTAGADSAGKPAPGCGFYLLGTEGQWLTYQAINEVTFSGEWKSYTATITTSDDTGKLGVRLGCSKPGPFDLFFDDVVLQKGKPRPTGK
jgi:hypothetical protein